MFAFCSFGRLISQEAHYPLRALRNGDSTTLLFQFTNTTGRRQHEEIAKRCVSIHLVWLVVILRACVLSFLSAARQTFELNLVMLVHDDGGWRRAAKFPAHYNARPELMRRQERESWRRKRKRHTRDNMKLSTPDNNLFVEHSAASNLCHFYREKGKPRRIFLAGAHKKRET